MKIVPVTRNELALDTDDWKRLKMLMTDFNYMCDSQSCDSCPLGKFCHEHESPAGYLKCLHEFLEE